MLTHDPSRRDPNVDSGTRLGVSTRALTLLFTLFLLPVVAVSRTARALKRVIVRAVMLVLVGTRRLAALLVASVHGATFAMVWATGWLWSTCLLALAWALHVILPIAAALSGAISAVARWVGGWSWWALSLAARALWAVISWVGRWSWWALSLAARALWAVISWVGRWSWWALSLAARALKRLVSGAVRLLGRMIARTGIRIARRVVPAVAAWLAAAVNRAAFSIRVAVAKAAFQAGRGRQGLSSFTYAVGPETEALGRTVPFTATVYQNEYLPRGGTEVNAIITVTALAAPPPADDVGRSAPEAAEVILLDCSGSMGKPPAKLNAARRATQAAIDVLRDGTWFAIVRGTERAELLYPLAGGLAQASPQTRRAAKRVLNLLWPEGGTAMGQWLLLARRLLAARPNAISHVILLTDGKNESEARAVLDTALAACVGRFQCACRGIGTDWAVDELRKISLSLLGSVDIVAEPADLEDDFRIMAEAAMAKMVGGVSLRVWTPRGATMRFLKQVSPSIADITTTRQVVDDRTGEYPTGAWSEESRDYHLCVRVPSRAIGDEMLAARVSLIVGNRVASQGLVKAIWSEEEERSTRINPSVAHYTGQANLATAIQCALEARRAGDDRTATIQFGRAVRLARESGNEATLKLLSGVVHIDDAATGTVRLRRQIDQTDEMTLDTRSTKTVRV